MVQCVTFMYWIDGSDVGETLFPVEFCNCPGGITIADIKNMLLFNYSDDGSITANMMSFCCSLSNWYGELRGRESTTASSVCYKDGYFNFTIISIVGKRVVLPATGTKFAKSVRKLAVSDK